MRRQDCSGIWVPLVTPFTAAGEIELDAIAPQVERLLAHGVRGLVALGTTGEAAHLSDDEAEAVTATAVRAVRGRVPVLGGSGRASTRSTIVVTRRLAAVGADGALVITPSAYRARMDGAALRRHYEGVASASPVPVFVYHIPDVTGIDLDPETLSAILAHPNVWGFKDSSPTGGPLAATLQRLAGAPAAGFVGSASRLVAGYEAGAAGAILAVANVVPAACVALDAAWRRGDRAAARAWQEKIAAVTAAWAGGWAVASIKALLRADGITVGSPRSPLDTEPPAEMLATLAQARAACAVA